MVDEHELQSTEAIYDALDRDDPEAALALATAALRDDDDPVLLFLAGRALFELERSGEAAERLQRAVALDPDDAEFRAHLAWALLRDCRFDEAAREVREALTRDDRLPESHYVGALLAERDGRYDEADAAFARATALAPDWFPAPIRLSDDEFAERLGAARAALDDSFRRHLDTVEVIVDPLPGAALLTEGAPPLDPEQLLGLFVGVPLGEDGVFSAGGELPPRIFLFKRNLERQATDRDDLAEQIRVTLYHELGHYLGMDEDELETLGYG